MIEIKEEDWNEFARTLVESDEYGIMLRNDSLNWKDFRKLPLYKQILQDHEDAKKWAKTFTALARNFDIEDIDWNGGEIDFEIFFGKLEKDRQIVKKIQEGNKRWQLQEIEDILNERL